MSAASEAVLTISAPSSIVAINVTAKVSKRSAAMPAQSPTLSPTLSAITAGLRGSSSGMPASTLPTRSAPTSAPLVKMPPPSRAKIEISDPPNPRPTSGLMTSLYAAPGAAEVADGRVLAVQVGHGSCLNGLRDLAHAIVAGRLLQDPGYLPAPVGKCRRAADEG